MNLSIIVAASKNGVIGKDGDMPWGKKPIDGAYFARMTKGHTLIMGRKTFDSLPIDKMSDRNIVVVSRSLTKEDRERRILSNVKRKLDVCVAPDFNTALEVATIITTASGRNNIMVAGGESIYKEALKHATVDYIYLTEVDKEYDGDTVFDVPVCSSDVSKNVFSLLDEKKEGSLTYKVYVNQNREPIVKLELEDIHQLRNFDIDTTTGASAIRANVIDVLFQEPFAVALNSEYYYADTPIAEKPDGTFVPLSVPHCHPLSSGDANKPRFHSYIDKDYLTNARGVRIHVPLPGPNGVPLVRFRVDKATGEVKYAGRRPFNDTDWFSIYISTFNVSFN